MPAVFKAALRVPEGSARGDAGSLTNLMATDADKLGRWSWTLFFAAQWTFAVASLPAVAYFTYDLLGPAALVGAATVVLANQAALEIGKRTKPAVEALQAARDARAARLSEALASVRHARLADWTAGLGDRVAAARAGEMAALRKTRYLDALNVFVGCLASLAVPVAIFGYYALVQKKTLDPATAFTALAWINQMAWSMNTLPDVYNLWSSLAPSAERLAAFLIDDPGPAVPSPAPADGGVAVAFTGDLGPGCEALGAVDFSAGFGELVLVVGPVGSGKSTLLRVLARARSPATGSVGINRRSKPAGDIFKPIYLAQTELVFHDS